MKLTAEAYLSTLERMSIPDQLDALERWLKYPLEDGVRPLLIREYNNLMGAAELRELLSKERAEA